jgi:hypothetical protein
MITEFPGPLDQEVQRAPFPCLAWKAATLPNEIHGLWDIRSAEASTSRRRDV